MASLPNPPSLIEFNLLKFLVFDAPSDENLHLYIKEFERFHVREIVRCCDPTYSTHLLEQRNIKVHDWPFPDGGSPPETTIRDWRMLLKGMIKVNRDKPENEKEAIGVHCVAGLGRAPVLVAIALIESGMDPLAAVEFIRQKRRGSINAKQLHFLKEYKPNRDPKCIIS